MINNTIMVIYCQGVDIQVISTRYYVCLWNYLNTTISSLTNLNTFTVHIKNMLLNNDI